MDHLNPEDAKTLKLDGGEMIVAESAAGKRYGVAKIVEAIPKGVVKASFPWSEGGEEYCFPLPVKIKRGKKWLRY